MQTGTTRASSRTIEVAVPGVAARGYPIRIQRRGLAELGRLCAQIAPAHRYAVIADSHVAELYGRQVLDAFGAESLVAELFSFPAGEWNKSRAEWAELSDAMLRTSLGRDCVVVALGGGVTGDLAGFVASTYMRGVPVVQVPTTLLAMVDSSVGGKTGVDAGPAKNAVGAFHHPLLVLVDPDLLETLPPYQRIAGLAEVVKAGAIRDEGFFDWMEGHAAGLAAGDPDLAADLIARSVSIKAEVVSEDPHETGLRAILNFGHTVAHALESISGYALLHGEAVAAGMRVEARLGEELGATERGTADRLESLLTACGLPEVLDTTLSAERVLEAARPDKKAKGGLLRIVFLRRVGEVALAADGSYTHPLDAVECLAPLEAALRKAAEAADSPA